MIRTQSSDLGRLSVWSSVRESTVYTVAVLCLIALTVMAVVGLIGAGSSAGRSLDDVYARRREARAAAGNDATGTDDPVLDLTPDPDAPAAPRPAA